MAIIYTPEALQEAQQEFRDFFGVEPISTEDPAHLRRRIAQGKLDKASNADLELARAEFRRTFGVEAAPGEGADKLRRRVALGETGEGPATELEILNSRDMQWYYDKNSENWYVEYKLPNSNRTIFFEATPDQMDALLGPGLRPTAKFGTLGQLAQKPHSTFSGNVSEMEGTGNFEDEVTRVQTLALDEGRLPDWAKKDPAVMDALYIAQAEDKSNEWLLDQIAKTDGFHQRFPGINKLKDDGNLSLSEAVTGFLEYEAGVKTAMSAMGLSQDIVTPDIAGQLLSAGHSLKVVTDTVAGFKRMKSFKPALDAFNDVLVSQGQAPITDINDMLDFVGGRASADLYDIWESSSIQEASVAAGLGGIFTAEDAMEAALAGNHTLETATQSMQRAAQLLLRLRHEVDVNAFDLNHEELIDISLGQVPRSGRTQSEVQESINRAVATAQGTLKNRAKPFTAFGTSGTPQAASLRAARQES